MNLETNEESGYNIAPTAENEEHVNIDVPHSGHRMNEKELLEFDAQSMRQFKESDAGKILRKSILGLIQIQTSKLLDRRMTNEGKLSAITAEIRALNDVLNAIDEPEKELDWWMQALEAGNEIEDEDEMYSVPDEAYSGIGSVSRK